MSLRVSPLTKVSALLAVLGLSGCLKTEKFPAEPKITMKSFEQFNDSARLTISFTDGDGDIGLGQSDTNPPFDLGGGYYHNLLVDYDSLHNGTWVPVTFLVPLYYRVPVITPTGQNKALEGEISVKLAPYPIIPGTEGDSIRFRVKLIDRALHISNEVSTDAIVVQ
jgi:hypothetical protein